MTVPDAENGDRETTVTTTYRIETEFGVVAIPVDEYWESYTQAERDEIAAIFHDTFKAKDEIDGIREEIAGNQLTIRDFSAYLTYLQALKKPNATLIMQGDHGGQIYLTCPMKFVQCRLENLIRLLKDIDRQEWDCNEGQGAVISFQRKNPGDIVVGGMGGGTVSNTLWVHETLEQKGLKPLIEKVLKGEIDSITAKTQK